MFWDKVQELALILSAEGIYIGKHYSIMSMASHHFLMVDSNSRNRVEWVFHEAGIQFYKIRVIDLEKFLKQEASMRSVH